jgi:hypothetical protein
VFGPLCCAARVKSLGAAPGERDPWLLLAGRARAADAVDTPSEPFARAKSAGVPLAHRARAIAAMTAVARPSSRREKAQRLVDSKVGHTVDDEQVGGRGVVGSLVEGFRFESVVGTT